MRSRIAVSVATTSPLVRFRPKVVVESTTSEAPTPATAMLWVMGVGTLAST